ncbi:MAG: radical SAM protein [Candidatus Firestonebacteria bacterium]
MLKQLLKIPLYRSFRSFGFPKIMPFSYTISVTYKCNSRCKTCGIWERKAEEFTLEEFDRTFVSLGNSPYWVTISGGEPFLRKDTVDIVKSLYKRCSPGVINIPTNGILSQNIPEKVESLVSSCGKSNIVINLSLDEVGAKHDEIRGVPGNYAKSLETYAALRKIKAKNFTLGIHTVISKFNVKRFREIYAELAALEPDSYITEIAEQRGELLTETRDITPETKDYLEIVDFLSAELKRRKFKGVGRLARAVRLQYYSLLKESLLKKKEIIPCYAGITTAQLAPDGNVWFCCIKAEPAGNLRENNYDFKRIWKGAAAETMRKEIKDEHCFCPLANMAYTNIMMHYPSLFKTGVRYIAGA